MKRTERVMIASAVCYGAAGVFLLVEGLLDHPALIIAATFALVRFATSVLILLGLRVSGRRTSTFPAGLYKLENLAAIVVGAVIIVFAYAVAREMIFSSDPGPYKWSALVYASLAGAAVMTAVLGVVKMRAGRAMDSPSVIAEGRTSLADCIAISIIIIGVGLEMAGIDHGGDVAAVIVSLYMIWTGGRICVNSVKVLLDATIDRDTLDRVRNIALSNPAVKRVDSLVGRNSGRYRFIELYFEPFTSDLREANAVSEELEREITKKVERVDQVIVEPEAEPGGRMTCALPVEVDGNTVSRGSTPALTGPSSSTCPPGAWSRRPRSRTRSLRGPKASGSGPRCSSRTAGWTC